MSCCPNNAGASNSTCPGCDGKGATTSPPGCQCNYNLGPVLTCCCMQDNNPPAGCCTEPTTSTMRLPLTLSATLSDQNLCPCVSGGFDLVYDSTNNWWIGSGSLGSCGHTVQLKFGCDPVGGPQCSLTCGWWMSNHYPDACAADQDCASPVTYVCGPPFRLEFHLIGPNNCGCGVGSASYKVVVTL